MADRSVAISDTLNTLRTTYNSTAADVGSIASLTSASGTIASSTDIVEAIVAMNTEIAAIKAGTSVFETKITFEGATDDAYETVLAITDPTADRTITFPNATGTVSLLTATETLTNKTLTTPTINGGTFSGTFTGTQDLTGVVLSGASPLVFEGATADAYETTLTFTDPTADRVITMPNATDTLVGKATTDTLTNKSIDLGTNTLTGSVAEFNSALQSESFATLTGTETLTNKTLASPTFTTQFTIGSATISEAELEILDGASVSTAELNILDGVTASAAQLNYSNISTLGTSQASKVVTVDSSGDLIVPDSDKYKFGAGSDMQLYHDGTNSYITNATGALKIATETSGIALTIGHSTSQVTIADNLTVVGNLTVTGTETIQDTVTMQAQNAVVFEGATADDYETTLTIVDPTADRTVYMPNATGYLPLLAAASTTTITATPAELNYSDGVTSAIQTQMDTKATKAFSIAQAVALG